ncbi:MAG: D-xylose transporter XylE, partial [Sphingobacteriales bacterium]
MAFINTQNNTTGGVLKGNPLYILLLTTVATLGGLLFGYDTAVVNGAEKSLVEFYISDMLDPAAYVSKAVPLIAQYHTLLTVILVVVSLIICGQILKLAGKAKGFGISAVHLIILGIWAFRFMSEPVPSDAAALKDTADAVKGFVVSSALIGCIIGGASAGWIS